MQCNVLHSANCEAGSKKSGGRHEAFEFLEPGLDDLRHRGRQAGVPEVWAMMPRIVPSSTKEA